MHNKTVIGWPAYAVLASLSVAGVHAQQLSAPSPDERDKAPAHMAPNAPKVTCNGGQLTVVADNSTMGSVLAEVRTCIGITLDIPEGSLATRMYTNVGPGPINQVLESLLSSTDLDYVIQASELNPEKVQTVLLMTRTKDPKDVQAHREVAMTPARQAWLDSQQNLRNSREGIDDSRSVDPEPVASKDVPLTAASTPAQDADPNAPPKAASEKPASASVADGPQSPATALVSPPPESSASTETPTQAPPDPSPNTPAVRETQDKITSMQQMFEQRKQMIENQAASPKQP